MHRQSSKDFIEILDAIRVCSMTDKHIEKINERLITEEDIDKKDFYISLVTTNAMANSINNKRLGQLTTKEKMYQGVVEGKYNERNTPT